MFNIRMNPRGAILVRTREGEGEGGGGGGGGEIDKW
jgi:hypothetical protein